MIPSAIRKCRPGDEAALSLLGQATFLETFAGVISGRDILGHCAREHSADKYVSWLNDPASAVWVAEVEPGRAPVGYLVLTTPDLPLADLSPHDAEVKRIYLLSRFHGSGIGRRLMDEARRHAAMNGRGRLLLGVYEGNTAAIRFYEKSGFKRTGERTFKVGESVYHDFIFALEV
jgi:ribosomal protein S18 acetylase RimI-like enzyme